MVIGNGLLAKSFSKYEIAKDIIIFASGVSNSKANMPEQFERERNLLRGTIQNDPEALLVYFSTTSVNDPDLQHTSYVQHKLEMEALIQQEAVRWQIFRLSNLAGTSSNPNTVLNFFHSRIQHDLPFDLWIHSERNIIDVDDVFSTVDHILTSGLFRNEVINIANTSNYPVQQIVQAIEQVCKKKAQAHEIEKGSGFSIDLDKVKPVYDTLQIHFDAGYLLHVIGKYYT